MAVAVQVFLYGSTAIAMLSWAVVALVLAKKMWDKD